MPLLLQWFKCDEMAAEFKFKDRIEAEEALKFRYQFDVRCR